MKRSFLLFETLLLGGVILLSGCGAKVSTHQAANGNTVQVEYTGKLSDGTIFDSSVGKQPLEFTVGSGQVVPGFDKAVLGMKIGQSKTVTIPAAEAYGPHRDDLVSVINKKDLPAGGTIHIGDKLRARRGDGIIVDVTVIAVSDTTITIDANHPLAGQDLTFEIKLVAIK